MDYEYNSENRYGEYDHTSQVQPQNATEKPIGSVNTNIEPQVNTITKKKKGGFARFLGRSAILIASGLVFGLCAAVAFGIVNYYTYSSKEDSSQFDMETYKTQIEKDILTKMNREIDNNATKDVIGTATSNSVYTPVIDVSNVVDKVMPSVVSITNSYTAVTNFWGQQYSEQVEGSGSGIIIGENDSELLIATNNHVIADADELSVQFIDGSTAKANVKGSDADMDIAVIAVSKDELDGSTKDAIAIAELGDSDELKVGEPAIAIGNALGYGQSVTTGVISALDREIEIEEGSYSQGFIQTDAAINPGNSGGALLNIYGQVIGINSNKIGGSRVEGMGYAIPISSALPIIDDLKTKKTKAAVSEGERGFLGISGRGVSQELSEIYDFPEGVYIYEVYEGTGAEKAGLRKGDVITKFDGTTINSMEKLQENLSYYEAGETVEITIERLDETGEYHEKNISLELVGRDALPAN